MHYQHFHTPTEHGALAVTYICPNGHAEIKFWRQHDIARTIVCPSCMAEAIIMPEELERHALMFSNLSTRLQ
jgi:hypothetical protein